MKGSANILPVADYLPVAAFFSALVSGDWRGKLYLCNKDWVVLAGLPCPGDGKGEQSHAVWAAAPAPVPLLSQPGGSPSSSVTTSGCGSAEVTHFGVFLRALSG